MGRKQGVSWLSILLIVVISFSAGAGATLAISAWLNKDGLTNDQIALLNSANSIIKNEAIENHDQDFIVEFALKGMAAALNDEYAYYFTEEELDSYIKATTGVVEGGIGAYILEENNSFILSEVYKGLSAYSAGIRSGDELIKVNGESVKDLAKNEVIAKVKGEVGTEVNLTVLRDGKELAFNVMRIDGQRELVEYKMIGSILYTRIVSFHSNAAELFAKALKYGEQNGYNGIIIDLRDNIGGELDVFVEIADYLLKEGEVFYALDKDGNKIRSERSDSNSVDKKMCVIVNGESASASEALCGALRDLGDAKIVGTKTYGKGVMQSNYILQNGGMFKLTTAKYYLPNGECIHGEGITPEYIVELPEEYENKIWMLNEENDAQLKKAIEVLTK